MANEISALSLSGQSLTFDLQVGATATSTGNAMTEVSGTGYYYGNAPSVAAGLYTVLIKTGSTILGIGQLRWDGSAEVLPATVAQATAVETDTQDIQSRIPAALVSGRMDASVGAMASNTMTAAALATDAVTEMQSGLATAANLATVDTVVDAIKAKTDNLPAAPAATGDIPAASAVAGAVRTELATELGRIDAAVSTRLATAGYTTPPTATVIADTLLDRDMGAGTDSGSATHRTLRQAAYALRNRSTAVGTTLTVYKTDDTTTSWTGALTVTEGANPVTGMDPA